MKSGLGKQHVSEVNSNANIDSADVIGNKDDTYIGNSIVSLLKNGGASLLASHEHVYPTSNGEGDAVVPLTVSSDASDKTHAASTTKNFWGEPTLIVSVGDISDSWLLTGYVILADTASKIIKGSLYRIVSGITASYDVAGNAWDEGATVLTVDDGSLFVTGDLIWVTSSAYKPDGEIVRITDVTGNVITIEREASQFGVPNTGLRWDHQTNIGAGTIKIYLCRRDELQYHCNGFYYSAPSSKSFERNNFKFARAMEANDGLIIRTINSTDAITCTFGLAINYSR